MEHPIIVKTYTPDERPIDEGECDTLDDALACVRTLVEDAGPHVGSVTVTLAPGWRLVNGEPMYSSDWLS